MRFLRLPGVDEILEGSDERSKRPRRMESARLRSLSRAEMECVCKLGPAPLENVRIRCYFFYDMVWCCRVTVMSQLWGRERRSDRRAHVQGIPRLCELALKGSLSSRCPSSPVSLAGGKRDVRAADIGKAPDVPQIWGSAPK